MEAGLLIGNTHDGLRGCTTVTGGIVISVDLSGSAAVPLVV
jgi:hypothetical protein